MQWWQIAALVLAVLLAACGNQQMEQIQVGMNRAQVETIMGRPNFYREEPEAGLELLGWTNRMMSGWSWDRADYWVLLTEGRVTDYGTGAIRRAEINVFAAAARAWAIGQYAPGSRVEIC